VEGSYPHSLTNLTEKLLHPLTHFISCFVGEGNCKDLGWIELTRGKKMGYSMSEDPRLSRSSTGNN
jgi:hypothetical protein